MPAPFTSPEADYAMASFMGAKVRSFTTSVGWNMGSPSQLQVQLVDDPVYGAAFNPPDVGTAVFFACGQFQFGGLFQKYEQKRDTSGNPVYTVDVVDPREILEGAQVIVSGYKDSVGGVRNLFNAYGFWESQAFGASLSNPETGMPWYKVQDAVLSLCNTPAYTSYGGPLTFRGTAYSLDLSELPQPPAYYRVGGGVSVGLLELIAQICEDGGYDFFVELRGYTIKIRTASRRDQPPLGTIAAIANTNWGNRVVRTSNGVECRNELTSAFLVGGEVATSWNTTNLQQFWGYDFNGDPVVGSTVTVQMRDAEGRVIDTVQTEQMDLNAQPVADIVGSVRYTCTALEMRLAQVNYESWAWYMTVHRKGIADMVGLPSPFRNNNVAGAANALAQRPNMVNDDPVAVANALQGELHDRGMRLYEFVRGYADEYMGRKFLAGLPFIVAKRDPDTLQVTTNWEVADGGYMPEGQAPLGVSVANEDILKTPDGRFKAFVAFGAMNSADITKVPTQGGFIENNVLYQECQVDPQIITVRGVPVVVVSLSGPVCDRELEPFGDNRILAWVFQCQPAQAQALMRRMSLPLKVAPATRKPSAISIPLKSNVLTYGPWFAQGAPGKVRFEQDPGLTPWGYGGYSAMNAAGECRVATAVTNQQLGETGSIELAGTPAASLGDILQGGGPNITAIDVQFGTEGVTTSYRFQTFTQRFGVFSRGHTERLKRLALTGVSLRRQVRTQARENREKAQSLADAARAHRAWRERQARASQRQTPFDTFIAHADLDTERNVVRVNPGVATMEESLTLLNASNGQDYTSTSMMAVGGLIRPFATSDAAAGPGLPKAKTDPLVAGTGIPNGTSLNPWKAKNDIEVFAYGASYQGAHAYRRNVVGDDARVFGLRGPLVVVGWGFDTDCKPVPGTNGNWEPGYLTRQDKWKAGPVDLLWDERRGVWTCHGAIKGTTTTAIAAGGSGTVNVNANGTNYTLAGVKNFFTATSAVVPSGKKVILNYIASDNAWYVVAADC